MIFAYAYMLCLFKQVCFICKQKAIWRCVRCTIAAHTKCSPWPEEVIPFNDQPNRAVCWRHPKDWSHEGEVKFLSHHFFHHSFHIFIVFVLDHLHGNANTFTFIICNNMY